MGSGQSQQVIAHLQQNLWRKPIEPEEEPGDLIEISWGIRKHWAVYVGDGFVVHVTSQDSAKGFSLVKKERLEDVKGKHKARINNSWDATWKPRDPKDIVRDANAAVGKDVIYDPITKNNWHFAKELRYALPPSSQEPEREPEPGDLIEIFWGIRKHWAVYVGDGFVVHVTSQDSAKGFSLVKKERLEDVKGKYKAQINNSWDATWKPRDPKDIVRDANAAVGKEISYNLITNYSWHFARRLRYGIYQRSQEPEREPKPEDLIEISRSVSKHWAVYVGDGYVVYVTSQDSAKGFSLVKKERLEDVKGKHKARINNSWDATWKPRDPKDIVRDANAAVGKDVIYDPITKNNWHFAKELRYALPPSSQEPEPEPEWEPECESELEPEPGDLIEIYRGFFKHWAVYVGDGDVVHVSSADGVRGVSVRARKAVVKREQLKMVKGKHKARINNSKDKKLKPSDPKYIVHEANAAVGEEFAYNLFTWNCEHFATWLRYRIAVSSQVANLMTYLASLVWPSTAYISNLYGKLSKKFSLHSLK